MGSIDTIKGISSTYNRLKRLRRIVHVLIRYGFGSIVESLRSRFSRLWSRVLPFGHRSASPEIQGKSVAERLCCALAELGPTFVKLGQILATRQDIIPASFVIELAKLQDNVPPFSMSEVRETIRQELGGELEDFFSSFDERPVGAASMAQGHRAVLKDGTTVFVKIQRPGIAKKMKLDLELLHGMAESLEKHSTELASYRPVKIVDEFVHSLRRELDFSHERANQEQFYKNFAAVQGVHIPKVYPQYCTRRMIVMEFIDGIKGTNIQKLKDAGVDTVAVSHVAADALLKQFFEFRFFHADPHPGNIIFLRNGEMCYVDFGQCCRVTEHERDVCAHVMQDVILGDYKSCAADLLELTDHNTEPNMDELERSVCEFIETYLKVRLNKLDVSSILAEFNALCKRSQLYLKPQFYLLLKALGVSDMLGRELNPDFEILTQIRPFVIKMALERFKPNTLMRQWAMVGTEASQLIKEYPHFIRQLNNQLVQGRLALNVKNDGVERLNSVLDCAINRLASAVVLAAMIIGSSIVIHANPAPHWYETSILGVLGFVLSAIFGTVLLISLWHHRDK